LIDEIGKPQWTGNMEEPPPTKGVNFQGPWEAGMKDDKGKEIPMSHPNSRCTLSNDALGNYSDKNEDPEGVETRIITYSGRDSDTMPPIYVAATPDQGVVIGACIVSAATATEVGVTGVRRQPWANAPFTPGSLGDYMDAQFDFWGSSKIAPDKQPILAGLNYFLTHEARGGDSKKLIGEKRDVKVWMAWLESRAHGEIDAIETPIGYLPKYEDLKTLFSEKINKEYPEDLYNKQFSLYVDNIVGRIDLQLEAYGKEKNTPPKFFDLLKEQRAGLTALKKKYGSVVSPKQLQEG
jgi:phosphoenolpyruvate carboxykinase (GTP)